MTQETYQTAMEVLSVIAKHNGGMISQREIIQVVTILEPHISVRKLEALIRDCKQRLCVVPHSVKKHFPEQGAPAPPPPPDYALMDKILRIQLREKTDPTIRREWMARVEADPDLQPVMALLPNEDADTIAQKLDLTKEEVFLRQRKIFNLYYNAVYRLKRRR